MDEVRTATVKAVIEVYQENLDKEDSVLDDSHKVLLVGFIEVLKGLLDEETI